MLSEKNLHDQSVEKKYNHVSTSQTRFQWEPAEAIVQVINKVQLHTNNSSALLFLFFLFFVLRTNTNSTTCDNLVKWCGTSMYF